MEYFLPLSVMAMIISSLSFFLIDYQKPTTSTGPENNQNSSNPTDSMENSADELLESKKELLNSNPSTENTIDDLSTKFQKTDHHFANSNYKIQWQTSPVY